MLQKKLIRQQYRQKFPLWLQQKTIANGIETFWPPHLSFLVWLRVARISKRLVWHHKTTDSPRPPCHKYGYSLPSVRVWRHTLATPFWYAKNKHLCIWMFITSYFCQTVLTSTYFCETVLTLTTLIVSILFKKFCLMFYTWLHSIPEPECISPQKPNAAAQKRLKI